LSGFVRDDIRYYVQCGVDRVALPALYAYFSGTMSLNRRVVNVAVVFVARANVAVAL